MTTREGTVWFPEPLNVCLELKAIHEKLEIATSMLPPGVRHHVSDIAYEIDCLQLELQYRAEEEATCPN